MERYGKKLIQTWLPPHGRTITRPSCPPSWRRCLSIGDFARERAEMAPLTSRWPAIRRSAMSEAEAPPQRQVVSQRHYPAARSFARNRARSTVVSGRPAVGGERDRPEKSYRGAQVLRNWRRRIGAWDFPAPGGVSC